MSELMTRPVATFTIGYEAKDDDTEFHFARRISQRYGTDHHETRINGKEAQDAFRCWCGCKTSRSRTTADACQRRRRGL